MKRGPEGRVSEGPDPPLPRGGPRLRLKKDLVHVGLIFPGRHTLPSVSSIYWILKMSDGICVVLVFLNYQEVLEGSTEGEP